MDPDTNGLTAGASRSKEKPAAGSLVCMVYDEEWDRCVLFNGETWTYDLDGNEWSKMRPEHQPRKRYGARMVYDAESDRAILFGGGCSNETWAYDTNNDTWTRMSPASSPDPRQFHALAYDRSIGKVVLFGGGRPSNYSSNYVKVYDDTWLYDFNNDTWMKVESGAAGSPLQRVRHCLFYSEELGMTVLSGGVSFRGDMPVKPEVWGFDGEKLTWFRLTAKCPVKPLCDREIVELTGRGEVLIYGGTALPRPAPDTVTASKEVKVVSVDRLTARR